MSRGSGLMVVDPTLMVAVFKLMIGPVRWS